MLLQRPPVEASASATVSPPPRARVLVDLIEQDSKHWTEYNEERETSLKSESCCLLRAQSINSANIAPHEILSGQATPERQSTPQLTKNNECRSNGKMSETSCHPTKVKRGLLFQGDASDRKDGCASKDADNCRKGRLDEKDGSASEVAENSKKGCYYVRTDLMHRLDEFLMNRSLTKAVEVPGTSRSRSCRISDVALMETRVILRRSIRCLYELFRSGSCLSGSYSMRNFLINEDLFVTLDYKAEDVKTYSKEGALADLQNYPRLVKEMFASEVMPDDIVRWLIRILRAGRDYEYLISYDCPLMEHNQVLSTFMILYSKFQAMETSDTVGYEFVLDHLEHFSGWSRKDLHNSYFIETYEWEDPITKQKIKYGSDVPSLLRLIRNTFQHIKLKTIDSNGRIIFGEEEYEYMLNDQFPGLLNDFMGAMYIAGYLTDLNLEFVMV